MRKEDLTQHFIDSVKQRIFDQMYIIGGSLPPLRQLAQEFGCSRSVINVGIARLASEGYLVIHKRQRTIINNFMERASLAVLKDMAFSENAAYRQKAVTDILAARKLIEVEAVRLAAGRRAPTKALEDIIAQELLLIQKGDIDYKIIAQKDFEFHFGLIELSSNAVYYSVMSVFSALAQDMTQNFYRGRADLFTTYVDKHGQIAAAIKKGDAPLAVALLEEILQHGERAYKNLNS